MNTLINEFRKLSNHTDNECVLGLFMGYNLEPINKPYVSIKTPTENPVHFISDWNSLMPVVEKIEQLRDDNEDVIAHVGFGPKYCEITTIDCVFECEAQTKILAVYNACVEFVKWFNNQNQESKYFIVSGFWKDDKLKFSDYIIKEFDIVDENEDIDIFKYGYSEEDLNELISLKWDSEEEFVITSYEVLKTVK